MKRHGDAGTRRRGDKDESVAASPRGPVGASLAHPSSFETARDYLNHLLSERNNQPERAAEIDELMRKSFEQRVAILVLDLCNFTRVTIEHGIFHYLAIIRQMVEVATPAVTANGGRVIKQEADNLFAAFDNPSRALESALDILRALDAVNSVVTADRRIYASIGIGYGDTLVIGDEDMFGAEMNLACKLGEDIAQSGEILLTPAAFSALPDDRYVCNPARISIEGMEIVCYRYEQTIHREVINP